MSVICPAKAGGNAISPHLSALHSSFLIGRKAFLRRGVAQRRDADTQQAILVYVGFGVFFPGTRHLHPHASAAPQPGLSSDFISIPDGQKMIKYPKEQQRMSAVNGRLINPDFITYSLVVPALKKSRLQARNL